MFSPEQWYDACTGKRLPYCLKCAAACTKWGECRAGNHLGGCYGERTGDGYLTYEFNDPKIKVIPPEIVRKESRGHTDPPPFSFNAKGLSVNDPDPPPSENVHKIRKIIGGSAFSTPAQSAGSVPSASPKSASVLGGFGDLGLLDGLGVPANPAPESNSKKCSWMGSDYRASSDSTPSSSSRGF